MLRPVFALGYVIATIILIYRNELHETYTSKQSKLIYKWLTLLIVMSILLYLGFLVFTLFVFNKMDYYSSYNQGVFMLYCTIAGLILLNISLLFFPNILYGLPQLDFAIVTKKNIAVEQQLGIAEDIKKQGKGFEISQERLSLLKLKVDTYVEKMPYLNLQFNLTMMSSDTDIPVHHLSYYFNEYMNINFNTWKNDLKIDYVIKKINDGSSEILTLDALAKQAGFGSRSSFINAFKLKTGQTPSEYLQNLD
jgi:AraC-like DNA-binding protein